MRSMQHPDYLMRPLLSRFPALAAKLPLEPIGNLPTPVSRDDALCAELKRDNLFIKRDDLSGKPYGGNKVRKLEFLLAAAQQSGATRIITSGAAGSNHALATALYGTACGFNVTLMLFEQPWNPAIPQTLCADFSTGAELFVDKDYPEHLRHINKKIEDYTALEGRAPYCIPAGGSSPLGTIGYVNAAFELQEQILQGILPEPAMIFCALGTMGTAVGLLIGMQAAGLSGKLIGVRVVPPVVANGEKVRSLFDSCSQLLHQLDPSFPRCTFNPQQFTIEDNYFGEGYGISTSDATAAITFFKKHATSTLDPIYTGKAAAAFLAEARKPDTASVPLLFINSKSSNFPESSITEDDFRRLPPDVHHYFTHYGK